MGSPISDSYQCVAMYSVEYAKSGRAACKVCSEKIAKCELRVGMEVSVQTKHMEMSRMSTVCITTPVSGNYPHLTGEI